MSLLKDTKKFLDTEGASAVDPKAKAVKISMPDSLQKEPKKDMGPEKTSSKWKYFLMGLGVMVVLIGIFGVALAVRSVQNLSENPTVLKIAEVLNLPAARVNGNTIPYVIYIEDFNTLKRFYSSEQQKAIFSFTDEEISDQALSRLIINSVIRELAREMKVSITDEDVDEVKQKLLEPYSGVEEAEAELKLQYGWDMDTYTKKILKPLVLEQKVIEKFSESTDEQWAEYEAGEEIKARHILFRVEPEDVEEDVKASAEEVLQRIKDGEDFAALALEFGSDSTKNTGGDLGWFGRGVMVPDFESAIFELEAGQLGENLVKTQFGYHIVKVDEKRMRRDFNLFMNNKLVQSNIEISVPVHDPFEEFRASQAELGTHQ